MEIKPTNFLIQLYSVMISENSSRYPTLEKSYLYTAWVGLCGWTKNICTYSWNYSALNFFVYIKKIIHMFDLFRIYFWQPKFMSYKRLANESNNTHKQSAKSICHLPVLLNYPTFLFANSTHQFTLNVMLLCWFYKYNFAHNFFNAMAGLSLMCVHDI